MSGTVASATRVPWVVDALTVSDAATIRALADNPDLDRTGDGGPLVTRLLRRRVARILRTPDGPLPSAMPRDSAERRALREELDARLVDPALDDRLADAVADAAAYVRGGDGAPGPLAQTLFGRIFVPGFTATARTWEAAATISKALDMAGLWALLRALTVQPEGAQVVLFRAMEGDRNGAHAIGVAVHNFAATLRRMRALDRATPQAEAMAQAMVAPKRVLRQGMSVAETVAGRVRPGTFVVLETRAAAERTLDPRVAFLTESWSGCPAHAFVPRLAARIWREAGGAE